MCFEKLLCSHNSATGGIHICDVNLCEPPTLTLLLSLDWRESSLHNGGVPCQRVVGMKGKTPQAEREREEGEKARTIL